MLPVKLHLMACTSGYILHACKLQRRTIVILFISLHAVKDDPYMKIDAKNSRPSIFSCVELHYCLSHFWFITYKGALVLAIEVRANHDEDGDDSISYHLLPHAFNNFK